MWQFIGNLLVSVVIAAFTVQLSLRRFYREKWWERRLDAYTQIIVALHHMSRSLQISVEEELSEAHYAEEYKRKASAEASAGWAEIRKATDMGELLMSAEALALLERLLDETDKLSPPEIGHLDYLEGSLSAVKECLKGIIALAKQDLRLSPDWIEKAKRRFA